MKMIPQSAKILRPSTMTEGIEQLKLIEYAGRTCYLSRGKTTDDSYLRFIKSLVDRGHESPLEHVSATLELITGRDVLAEITRHRLASFSVESQRYVRYEDGLTVIEPVHLNDWKCQVKNCWLDQMNAAEHAYQQMRLYDVPPEDARKVLPQSTATDIVMTANLREWLHILELRESPRAYPEMRELASLIRTELNKVYPYIFEKEKSE